MLGPDLPDLVILFHENAGRMAWCFQLPFTNAISDITVSFKILKSGYSRALSHRKSEQQLKIRQTRPTMSPHFAPIATICVLLSASLVEAIPELIQVHVITRHGSRTALEKSGSTLVETTSPILTPLGEQQLYELGTWLRQRYAVDVPLLGKYVATEVRFESSDLERTISSANSLSLGVYPPANRTSKASMLPSNLYPSIPIYMKGARNDLFLRAYDKCPAYQNALDNLYESDSWKIMEAEHRTLLSNLGRVAEFQSYVNDEGYVPLSDVWNVFDLINVAKTECAAAAATDDTDCEFHPLDYENWSELQTIAHLAEFQRYSNTTARDWLGANLLFQIHQRMGGNTSGFAPGSNPSDIKGFRKFFHYSAHYPTILSVFAALNVSPPSDEVIPGYSDALIFELYHDTDTGVYSVDMLYKEANSANSMTIRFPAGPCQGATSCALGDLTQLLSSMSYTSLEEWCVVCENDSADVCLEVKLNAMTPQDTAVSADMATCSISGGSLIGVLCGGLILGVLLHVMFQKVMAKKITKDVDIEAINPDKSISLDDCDKIT